jgi:hypothetical protein
MYRQLLSCLMKVSFAQPLDYVARRYRQQRNLAPEVLVTVCLHLDEYHQAGKRLAKDLAKVPGSYLAAPVGGTSEAAKARVVLLPIFTDVTRDVFRTRPAWVSASWVTFS